MVAACGETTAEVTVTVRGIDDVQVMSAADAQRLLDGGPGVAGEIQRNKAEADALEVTESGRSFQTRLSTALSTFGDCLSERGFSFIGLPGQGDPEADEADYISALIACNAVSGISSVLQEQNARQQELTAAQKTALNENARDLVICMLDRGWQFGEMVPNQNGILSPTSFPPDVQERNDEFSRDLEACGWFDLDLG
jgi:hypothetical protein